MSKVTFRADDDLVARIEAMDTSKSEVMREALRAYLGSEPSAPGGTEGSLDSLITDKIDRRIDDRLAGGTDLTVTVAIEDDRVRTERDAKAAQTTQTDEDTPDDSTGREHACQQCGEPLEDAHAYCPNCGEKATDPATCHCGIELRSDWAFCPDCGRRTPAADVLDP
ncbi:double zinc ribbon domain-containing protein [Halalkalicoccus subterraneus]|uniref:double zinc ribbon domain-containing protein n=1 Tax=Halalkalicoccus subterraneus TaxID=2675002 RepID=UPI000EFA5EF0|nr:zinc ribbon domain-containing protein [Halalkalicoccus subterraneus]